MSELQDNILQESTSQSSKPESKHKMLNDAIRKEMEKQQYRIVGEHSAVKICGWTKNMIKGQGGCYKLKFYGIMSNQCMQMTTSISCANRCTFCWRGYKAPVSKDWKWNVDDPKFILGGSIKAHHNLLAGFNGNPQAIKPAYQASKTVKHVALSLTGEPIIYPRINEMIEDFDKQGISTFLVTNAQYPDQIRDLRRVTQLYVSLDAPDKDLLKKIDLPLFKDYWERLNASLEHLSKKKDRTCIRLTVVKDINDSNPKGYADMIKKGNPDFIEVKAYMHVGPSRERLTLQNMPWHEEVVEFTKKLAEHLPEYEIVTDHVPSRVIMMAKKDFKINGRWHTWIDFEKYQKLVTSGNDFDKFDFVKPTPQIGLSGRNTKEEYENSDRKKKKDKKNNAEKEKDYAKPAENIEEIDLD